jgi:hypothetical protein
LNQFKYTITKFDSENKIVVVTFDDGAWTEIRLVSPLPKDLNELEEIIKRFTPPVEALQAKIDTTDLSYIDPLVGKEATTNRLRMTPEPIAPKSEEEQAMEAQMKQFMEEQETALLTARITAIVEKILEDKNASTV